MDASPSASLGLPRRFSPFNNGTPSFLGIRWDGSPRRSVIALAFHYEAGVRGKSG